MQQAEASPAAAATSATGTATSKSHVNGGRFDFDDGGTYCGGWEEGKAHGHGVCTGPQGQGAYSGSWHYGFEVSGVYTWPSGSCFEGQWQNGKRHGLGVETRGRWIYRGEWTQGFKGRYGVRQSNTSTAKYEGTWANGLQDGYGSETYADDGTYQGQWLRGMRHGYGVRNSAPFGKASKYRANKTLRASLTSLRSNEGNSGANTDAADKLNRRVDDSRGGFVLKMNSSEPTPGRPKSVGPTGKKGIFSGIRLRKQASTGDLDKRGGSGSFRSTGSTASWVSTDSAQSVGTNASVPSDSNASFVVEDEQMDPSVTETYMGEWKNDKRSGFGVSQRSDGLKYEGEWYANKKYGYGVTTFANGEKEEGKYKNNVLITSPKKKLFLMRSTKFRERIDAAVNAAQRASKIALQKADIAISRAGTSRGKGEQADLAAAQAREDSDVAIAVAKQYAPDFKQPGLDRPKYREPIERISDTTKKPINPPTSIPNQISDQNSLPNSNQILSNQITSNKVTTFSHQPPSIPNNIHNKNSIYGKQNEIGSIGWNSVANSSPTTNLTNSIGPTTNEFGPQELSINNNSNNNNNINSNELASTINKPRNSLPSEDPILPNPRLRRQSRRVSGDRPYLESIGQQSSKDHFYHYNRPPSRDSSVARGSSRQASVDRPTVNTAARPSETPDRTLRAPSAIRQSSPTATSSTVPSASIAKNGSVITGIKAGGNPLPSQPPPFEERVMRQKGLGQDIIPSPNQPKRTESLFIPGGPPVAAAPQVVKQNLMVQQPSLQRKKSLPDFQELPRSTGSMTREEVSYLGSARREEVRRQIDERERLRANPLLYLVSPQVKDWFSRQQLVIVVLFINISLAIMFFKLLT